MILSTIVFPEPKPIQEFRKEVFKRFSHIGVENIYTMIDAFDSCLMVNADDVRDKNFRITGVNQYKFTELVVKICGQIITDIFTLQTMVYELNRKLCYHKPETIVEVQTLFEEGSIGHELNVMFEVHNLEKSKEIFKLADETKDIFVNAMMLYHGVRYKSALLMVEYIKVVKSC